MKNRKGLLWSTAFAIIFLLSQDYLYTSWSVSTSFLGFPNWLGWFMLIHILFILVFAYFAAKFWKAN